MFELESKLPELAEALKIESASVMQSTNVELHREFLKRLQSIGFPSHHSLSIPLQDLVLYFTHSLAQYSLRVDLMRFSTYKAQVLQAAVDYMNIFDSMKYPIVKLRYAFIRVSRVLSIYCSTASELLILRGYLQRLLRLSLISSSRETWDESDVDLACSTEVKMRELGMKIARVTTECQFCGEKPGDAAIKLLRCGRCKGVAYCYSGCQKAHWKIHKIECVKIQ
jgi:hypothetical protein